MTAIYCLDDLLKPTIQIAPHFDEDSCNHCLNLCYDACFELLNYVRERGDIDLALSAPPELKVYRGQVQRAHNFISVASLTAARLIQRSGTGA